MFTQISRDLVSELNLRSPAINDEASIGCSNLVVALILRRDEGNAEPLEFDRYSFLMCEGLG